MHKPAQFIHSHLRVHERRGSTVLPRLFQYKYYRSLINILYAAMLVLSSSQTLANDDVDLFSVSLEELLQVKVVTSAKLPRSIKNSPGTITVFTAKEIALFGARDLTDVLAKIPGVLPFNDATTSKLRFSVRGDQPYLSNSHVLILLNGIPFNRGGNWIISDIVCIPLPAVEQIEVVRGPGSVLYGTNAYSGVVNIITKNVDTIEDAITLGGGDHQTSSADLSFGGTKGELKIISALRLYETEGNAISSNLQNGSPFKGNLGETTPGLLLGLDYHDFHALLQAGKVALDTLRGTSAQLVEGEISTDKIQFNLGYSHELAEDWKAQMDFSQILRSTSITDLIIAPSAPIEYESDDSRLEIQLRGNVHQNLMLILGTIVDGFSGHVAFPDDLIDDWDYFIFAGYGQLEYTHNATRIILGAQYNKVETTPAHWVPRIAIIQDFNQYTGLKLQYAKAFRAPYPAEMDLHFSSSALTIIGNPLLENELVTTWDLELFYHSDTLQSSINFFRNEQNDLINRVLSAPSVVTFRNQDELTIEGVELEAKYLLHSHYFFSGAISTQRNENSNGAEDVTLQPDLMAKLGVGFQTSDWSIGVFDNYLTSYEDNVSIMPNRIEINPQSKAHHLVSLNANWSPPQLTNIRLAFYIHNLLDEDIYVPSMPGFTHSAMNTLPSVDTGRAVVGKITIAF